MSPLTPTASSGSFSKYFLDTGSLPRNKRSPLCEMRPPLVKSKTPVTDDYPITKPNLTKSPRIATSSFEGDSPEEPRGPRCTESLFSGDDNFGDGELVLPSSEDRRVSPALFTLDESEPSPTGFSTIPSTSKMIKDTDTSTIAPSSSSLAKIKSLSQSFKSTDDEFNPKVFVLPEAPLSKSKNDSKETEETALS